MTLRNSRPDSETLDLSELRMATMYGIEGLKRCTDTDEYDEWLSLFDAVLEELERPRNRGRGNFPLKEVAIPNDDERQEIVIGLQRVSETAQELQAKRVERRTESRDETVESIQLAEELYEKLSGIQEESCRALKVS